MERGGAPRPGRPGRADWARPHRPASAGNVATAAAAAAGGARAGVQPVGAATSSRPNCRASGPSSVTVKAAMTRTTAMQPNTAGTP